MPRKRTASGKPIISAKEKAFNASEEQKKRRAARNKARRKAIKEGKVKKVAGNQGNPKGNPEVHHTRSNRKGKLSGPTRVVSKRPNRRKQPKRDGSQD